MAREPQPRTSGLSVEEADALGLTRNSLLDSAANWDSKGKQQLRKGYLQTILAAQEYVQDGPIGQAVEELMAFMVRAQLAVTKYTFSNTVIPADAVTTISALQCLLLTPEGDTSEEYQIRCRLQFSAAATGTVSLVSDVPLITCASQATLMNSSDETISSTSSDTALPSINYGVGVNIVEFNVFPIVNDVPTTIDVSFDNDSEVGSLNAGSFIECKVANL